MNGDLDLGDLVCARFGFRMTRFYVFAQRPSWVLRLFGVESRHVWVNLACVATRSKNMEFGLFDAVDIDAQ
jgi:hypothetical protein